MDGKTNCTGDDIILNESSSATCQEMLVQSEALDFLGPENSEKTNADCDSAERYPANAILYRSARMPLAKRRAVTNITIIVNLDYFSQS